MKRFMVKDWAGRLALWSSLSATLILVVGLYAAAQTPSPAERLFPNVQRGLILNLNVTSAVNVNGDIATSGTSGQRLHVYSIVAQCSAGTAEVQILDAGVIIWRNAVGTAPAWSTYTFPVGVTLGLGNGLTTRVTPCGVGNTSTHFILADRF